MLARKEPARRSRGVPVVPAFVVAVVALALLAAGCGGGRPAGVASVTSSASATDAPNEAVTGALAFARCMRSHGVPNWPDPNSSGEFDKAKLRQLGVDVSQVQALEQGPCNDLLPSTGQGATITPADRADYLRAAACMRSHGFPGFPDPTFRSSSVQTNIPSSVDQESSRFKSAAAICTKLIPAGLPYSSRGS